MVLTEDVSETCKPGLSEVSLRRCFERCIWDLSMLAGYLFSFIPKQCGRICFTWNWGQLMETSLLLTQRLTVLHMLYYSLKLLTQLFSSLLQFKYLIFVIKYELSTNYIHPELAFINFISMFSLPELL